MWTRFILSAALLIGCADSATGATRNSVPPISPEGVIPAGYTATFSLDEDTDPHVGFMRLAVAGDSVEIQFLGEKALNVRFTSISGGLRAERGEQHLHRNADGSLDLLMAYDSSLMDVNDRSAGTVVLRRAVNSDEAPVFRSMTVMNNVLRILPDGSFTVQLTLRDSAPHGIDPTGADMTLLGHGRVTVGCAVRVATDPRSPVQTTYADPMFLANPRCRDLLSGW